MPHNKLINIEAKATILKSDFNIFLLVNIKKNNICLSESKQLYQEPE